MQLLDSFLEPKEKIDIAPATMKQRMHKSPAELALIRLARPLPMLAAMQSATRSNPGPVKLTLPWPGVTRWNWKLPNAFLMPNIVIAGSGFSQASTRMAPTTQSPHVLEAGDILSLNTFPMISGYYTALERTLRLIRSMLS